MRAAIMKVVNMANDLGQRITIINSSRLHEYLILMKPYSYRFTNKPTLWSFYDKDWLKAVLSQ